MYEECLSALPGGRSSQQSPTSCTVHHVHLIQTGSHACSSRKSSSLSVHRCQKQTCSLFLGASICSSSGLTHMMRFKRRRACHGGPPSPQPASACACCCFRSACAKPRSSGPTTGCGRRQAVSWSSGQAQQRLQHDQLCSKLHHQHLSSRASPPLPPASPHTPPAVSPSSTQPRSMTPAARSIPSPPAAAS